jgi:hypothetical protein
VGIESDTIVVGAPDLDNDPDTGTAGAVHVFERTELGWNERQVLVPDGIIDGVESTDAGFGFALSLHGDTLVVGAPYENGFRGAVHVYTRTNGAWVHSQRIANPNSLSHNAGLSVSVKGDVLAFGAGGYVPAEVFVFVRSGATWIQQDRLVVRTGEETDFAYVRACRVDGDTLAISAGVNGRLDYTVRVYRRIGQHWVLEKRLRSNGVGRNDGFGDSLALAGDVLFVGDWQDNRPDSGLGRVYTRVNGAWTRRR